MNGQDIVGQTKQKEKKKKPEALKCHSANKKKNKKKKQQRADSAHKARPVSLLHGFQEDWKQPTQLLSFKAINGCITTPYRATESNRRSERFFFWSAMDKTHKIMAPLVTAVADL